MLAPKPFAESQVARLNDDPWGPVRRIVGGARYEALGDLPGAAAALPPGQRRQPVEGFSYGAFLQPSEGFLYAALIALAEGYDDKAATMFAQVLEHLPRLPASHDFWVSLTAVAAISNPQGAALFEAFLERHAFLNKEFLGLLPLPARNNFLSYCLLNRKLGPAMELVEDAGPDWNRDDGGIEVWAFRLAGLAVLLQAKRHDQAAAFGETYRGLLAATPIAPPSERVMVEFMLLRKLAEIAEEQSDTRAAVRHYEQAAALADRDGGQLGESGALFDLMLTLGRCHQSLGDPVQAQRAFERCVVIAGALQNRPELDRSLAILAALHTELGRHAEAVVLHSRRVALIERNRDAAAQTRQAVRLDLARALVASGNQAGGTLLARIVDEARGGGSASERLLVAALLVRIELGAGDHETDASFWDSIKEIAALQSFSAEHGDALRNCILRAASSGRSIPPDVFGLLVDRLGEVERGAATGAAQRMRDTIIAAEIGFADALLGIAEEGLVLQQLERVLAHGGALTWEHRSSLLVLATHALQAAHQDRYRRVGIAAIQRLPELPEPESGQDDPEAVHRCVEVHRRLALFWRRTLKQPRRAQDFARRALTELDAGGTEDQRTAATRKQLREILAKAPLWRRPIAALSRIASRRTSPAAK